MVQIPLNDSDLANEDSRYGLHLISEDIAYVRAAIVNVVYFRAADGGWVLIDAGVLGSKLAILSAALRFVGSAEPPKAIVLTHGHFDHVGALEDLAEAWRVPVYAHPLEHPYLNGKAAYPEGDPSVGGGMMAALSGYSIRPSPSTYRLGCDRSREMGRCHSCQDGDGFIPQDIAQAISRCSATVIGVLSLAMPS